jgi:hypothetical protein
VSAAGGAGRITGVADVVETLTRGNVIEVKVILA